MKDLVDDFTQRFWHDRLDSRLPVIATVLFILLLAHSLAKVTWNVVPLPEVEQSAIGEQRQKPRATRVVRDQPLANKIGNFNLFGKHEPKKAVVAPVKPAVVPETKLNLKLRGVFASKDKTAARAIIADARGDEDSYKIDSELPGGARLSEIHADRVILEHNGRFETLKLPVEAAEVADGAGGRASSGQSSAPPVDRNINRSNIETLSSQTTDNAQLLGQYRSALLNDPNSVMGLINVRPYQKDGQLLGYRLRPGKDRSLLRRLGLRSGDIVTSVNGVPMNNPVKALEVLRDLSTASQISVDVLRNGTPQSFTFSVQ
ncbi:type II secretion system protein GspC [Kaarinaea lacus]